jgi:hypothetical protein
MTTVETFNLIVGILLISQGSQAWSKHDYLWTVLLLGVGILNIIAATH